MTLVAAGGYGVAAGWMEMAGWMDNRGRITTA
jgi:hypothetical protein